MASASDGFKQILVDLRKGIHSAAAMHSIAELAELLGLEISARYGTDPGVARAAALPFIREFRLLEREWQALDPDVVTLASELSADAARRKFELVANAYRASHSFEAAGSAPPRGADAARSERISVVQPGRYMAEPVETQVRAAFRDAAGVLLLGGTVQRRTGPILAVSESEDDAISKIASSLAAAANERLILFNSSSSAALRETVDRRHAGAGNRERLIVIRRGLMQEAALLVLASRRACPVFVIDTGKDAG